MMATVRGIEGTVGLMVVSGLLAACTTILGDDFAIDPSAGAGATSAGGGSVGGSGGDGPCEAQHADCDGNAANGCETDLDTDPLHCGECSFACAGDLPCQGGQCQQAAGRLVMAHRSSCALLDPADGEGARAPVCWGTNVSNRLRDPRLGTTDADYRATAAPIPDVGVVRDIAVGAGSIGDGPMGIAHGCVLDDVTEVATCWGDNSLAQLGEIGEVGLDELREIELIGVSAIAAGAMHTCALLISGEIRCWGDNSNNQIGRDGAPSPSPFPQTVDGIVTATQIAVDQESTCARLMEGEVRCWGAFFGLPLTVLENDGGAPLNDATLVDVGGASALGVHGCAVREDRTVACWGSNFFGEVGNGDPCDFFQEKCPDSELAFDVPGLENVIDISLGTVHSCALVESGQIFCWGRNRNGEMIANDDTNPIVVPTAVPGLDDVIDIEAGGMHTCARRRTGQVVCFGENLVGELGDGTALTRVGFVDVLGLP
jgi:hypothetical protein